MHVLHKLLVLLLVLILPVQGVAAVFAPLHQAADQQSMSTMPCHGHQAEAQDNHHANNDSTTSTNSDGDAASHMCCHQVFSCAPTAGLNTAAQKISDVPQTAPLLHTLFVPDSPYRPPRG